MEDRHTPESGSEQRDDLIQQIQAHALQLSRAFFDPTTLFELDNPIHVSVIGRECHYISEKMSALLVCLLEDAASKVNETGAFEPKKNAWTGVEWNANDLFKEANIRVKEDAERREG